MIYSKEKKVIFVAIPKTGTRSVYKNLIENYGAELYREHFPIIPEEYKDYYSFTIVRNPYDRLISMWWSTCKRDISKKKREGAGDNFRKLAGGSELIDLLKWMNTIKYDGKGSELLSLQSEYLKNNKFDIILENEKLNNQFSNLPFLTNNKQLLKINTTTGTNNHNSISRNPIAFHYIDQECLELINKYYAEDFDMLPQYKKIEKI